MKTYTITAWCDRTFTSRFEVEAETPEAALELAREQVHHEEAEECDDAYPWDTFSVDDGGEGEPLNWRDDQARLREAAPRLLEALRSAADRIEALIDAGDDRQDDCKAYDEICAAIEAATGKTA